MMKLSPLILAVALGAAAAAEAAHPDLADPPALGATQDLAVDAAGRRLEEDENKECAFQTAGPCGDCVTWTFTNSKGNEVGCDWVAKNTKRRCKKEGFANPNLNNMQTGLTTAYESCPETCGTPCEEPACENDSCCDSASWFYKVEGKNCAWAGQGNKWRCNRADSTGAFAAAECPESCDNCDQAEANCDGGCCDSYSWYTHVPKKNCDWVAAKTGRCSKADPHGVLAEEACPATCGTCPDPTGQPTAKPTAFPTAPPTTVQPTGHPTADPTAFPTPSPTSAPTGLMFEEKAASTTYVACKALCAAEGGRLPCIADSGDNAALQTYINGDVCPDKPNPWLGLTAPFPDTGNPLNKEADEWHWRDMGPLTCDADTTDYENFAENPSGTDEPNNSGCTDGDASCAGESCAEMDRNGGEWNDIKCAGAPADERCCVCDMTFSWEAPTFQKAADPAGKDADALTKDDCESACTAIGARLPCIGSEGENQALLAYALGPDGCDESVVDAQNGNFGAWIGLSRAGVDVGGPFAWPAECPADLTEYDAWRSQDNEPTNTGGIEDAVEQYLASDRAGQWNDYDESKPLCCICDVTDATPFPTADPTAESTIGPTPV